MLLSRRRLAAGSTIDGPPAPKDLSPTPLGVPPVAPAGAGGYAFTLIVPGTTRPVMWDPCRPIHYVVRTAGAPPGALQLLPSAISEVSAATGLQFVADGVTDEAPMAHRPAYQPDRYGKRWAPVLISWSDPAETPALGGAVSGQGGPAAFGTGEPQSRRLVSGQVTFDGPQLAAALQRPGGQNVLYATMLHELGHLVGLAHVDDPTQLMFPQSTGRVVRYGAGDLRGLAQLGAGRCFTDH